MKRRSPIDAYAAALNKELFNHTTPDLPLLTWRAQCAAKRSRLKTESLRAVAGALRLGTKLLGHTNHDAQWEAQVIEGIERYLTTRSAQIRDRSYTRRATS